MTTDIGLRGLDLLDAGIAYIELHPETWKQEIWHCETGACLAGWIDTLAGGQWLTPGSSWLFAEAADEPRDVFNGKIYASTRARRLLGISDQIANDLFDTANTLDDLKAMRDELRARAAAGAS